MSTNDRKRLKAIEAAAYLRVTRSTLSKWRMNGNGPPYHLCGPRLVYYFLDEVDKWLEDCDRRQAGGPGGSGP